MNATSEPAGPEKLIDLSAFGRMIQRHKWPMLAAGGLVLALTVAAYLMATRRYAAEAIVAIGRQDSQIIDTAADKNTQVLTDSPSVDTEVQVLLSPAIAETAVRATKLNTNPAFLATLPEEFRKAPLSVIDAASWLRAGLTAERQGLSYAISVSYTSSDPAVSQLVANGVADAYVNGQVQTLAAGRSKNIQLLRARLNKLRGDVMSAESAVVQFRANNNLVDLGTDTSIDRQALANLNNELAKARADYASANAQAAVNRSGSGSITNASSVVSNLRIQASQLAAQSAQLSSRYGPLNPERQQVEAQLAAVRSALDRETSRAARAVGGDAVAARDRMAALKGAVDRTAGHLDAGNAASVRLNQLERIAESGRQLYQAFLDRYRVEIATQGTEKSRAYVISPAAIPDTPVSPDRLVYLLGGLIAAATAAGLVALFLEWRERGVRTRAEAEEKLQLPVVASVPDLATVKDSGFSGGGAIGVADHLLANNLSLLGESFRTIRSNLRLGRSSQVAKVVAVTSSIPGEGKTTTAICLARSAGAAGIRTLLIDCDVRRHASSRSLGNASRAGLVEVLEGKATLDEAIGVDAASGMHVLPLLQGSTTGYDLLQSSIMDSLLRSLRDRFDLVVLDTAPVLAVAETRAIAAMADTTLFVVRWRKTSVATATAAIDQLNRAGAPIAGTILTQVDLRATSALADDVIYYQAYTVAVA